MHWSIAGSDLGEQSTTCMQASDTPSSRSPTADPAMVFQKHFAKLAASIQSPGIIADFLYAEHLIGYLTHLMVNRSIEPVGQRSFTLLSDLEVPISVPGDQKSKMLSLCTALEESGELALEQIAADMRICITGKCPRPSLPVIMRSFNDLAHCRK